MPKKSAKDYKPDYPIPPGVTIEQLLDGRAISMLSLGSHMGFTPQQVRGLLNGNIRITPYRAILLKTFFDVPESFWLNLQRQYDEAKQKEKQT